MCIRDSEITGREKTPFSIWRKMQSKRISLEQLTDIVGFRVIVKNINDCYKLMSDIEKEITKMFPNIKKYSYTKF